MSSDFSIAQPRPEPVILNLLSNARTLLKELSQGNVDCGEVEAEIQFLGWELAYSRLRDSGLQLRRDDAIVERFVQHIERHAVTAEQFLAAGELDQALDSYRDFARQLTDSDSSHEFADDCERRLLAAWFLLLGREYERARALAASAVKEMQGGLDKRYQDLEEVISKQAARGKDIESHFRTNASKVAERVKRRVHDRLAFLLERFKATSGWIFLQDHEGQYVPAFSQNSSKNVRYQRLAPGRGLVGWVASTERPWLTYSVSQLVQERLEDGDKHQDKITVEPRYAPWEIISKSAITVPIFGPALHRDGEASELIAVLNMESCEEGNFSDGQLWELQREVAAFAPDILAYLARTDDGHTGFGWHPIDSGWDIFDLLQGLCSDIAESFAVDFSPSQDGNELVQFRLPDQSYESPAYHLLQPSCTIWYYDELSAELWVRATALFDEEYVAARTLSTTWPDRLGGCETLTGRAWNSPRGIVVSDHWRLLGNFYRGDKAIYLRLNQLSSLPIYEPNRKSAWGALNCYSFFDNPHPQIFLLRHVADLLGRQICQYEQSVSSIVEAWVTQEMSKRKCLTIEQTFEQLLDIVREICDAPASSIFALSKPGQQDAEDALKLTCVATTGLEYKWQRSYDFPECEYDVNKKSDSITVKLALAPGSTRRINSEPTSPRGSQSVRHARRYVETISLSETDHRRILSTSISLAEDRSNVSLGVIRVVRTTEQRPFLKSDELIIQAIGRAAHSLFEERWSQQLTRSYVEKVENSLSDKVRELLPPTNTISSRSYSAVRNLIRPISTVHSSSLSLVDGVLQSLLQAFDNFGSCHCTIREVCNRKPDGAELRLVAFHSVHRHDWPDELAYPTPRGENQPQSITWKCLQQRRILTFDIEEDRKLKTEMFRPINQDSKRVKCGVCVPFVALNNVRAVTYVLLLDFEEPIRWKQVKYHSFFPIILHGVSKLAAILSDANTVVLKNSEEYLCSFLAASVKTVGGARGRLDLLKRQSDKSIVPIYYGSPDVECESSATDWMQFFPEEYGTDLEALGIEAERCDNKDVILRLPLSFASEPAGSLTLGINADRVREFFGEGSSIQKLAEVFGLWGSVLVYPGGDDVEWTFTHFEDTQDDTYEGLTYWRATPALISLNQSIASSLTASAEQALRFSLRA